MRETPVARFIAVSPQDEETAGTAQGRKDGILLLRKWCAKLPEC